MTQGKLITPTGSRPVGSGNTHSDSGIPGWFRKIRELFHAAPAAMSGNSSSVMDQYMRYHRNHRGT